MSLRLAPTSILPRRRFVAGKLRKLLSLSGIDVVKEARCQLVNTHLQAPSLSFQPPHS